jgi:hypothetical protein
LFSLRAVNLANPKASITEEKTQGFFYAPPLIRLPQVNLVLLPPMIGLDVCPDGMWIQIDSMQVLQVNPMHAGLMGVLMMGGSEILAG